MRQNLVDVRRPLRIRSFMERHDAHPCLSIDGVIEACGGVAWREERLDLVGSDWRIEGKQDAETGGMASLALGPKAQRMAIWLDHGDGRAASGVLGEWAWSGGRVDVGVQRARVASRIGVSTKAGAMDLDWNDLSDSVGFGVELPVGLWQVRAGWWRGARRGADAQRDRMVDSIGVSGWEIGVRRGLSGGQLQGRLWREDRQGVLQGYRGEKLFLEQVVGVSRAGLRLDLQQGFWQVGAALREWQLESPKGNLDHPTIQWNQLAQGDFAPFFAIAENRNDYLWGELSMSAAEVRLGRDLHWGRFIVQPQIRGLWLSAEADLQRTRLTVKGFLPTTDRDTLVSGSGWLALVGPRLSVSRPSAVGRGELWAGIRLPVAGSWSDAYPKTSNVSSTPEEVLSLPIDPLGNWECGVSWEL